MKNWFYVVIVLASFLASACGEMTSVTSPSTTTAGRPEQTNSSLVNILD